MSGDYFNRYEGGKTSKLLIFPKPPYNFELSLDFMLLREGSGPFPERRMGNGLLRAFLVNDRVIPAKITFEGSINKPRLVATSSSLPIKTRERIKEKIIYWLNLNDDLSKLYRFMERDEKLRKIKEKLYGLKVPKMGVTVYEVVIKSIIQQQISLYAAFKIISNLVKAFGENITFEGEKFYGFPKPDKLANASILQLRRCGLSQRKAKYIINFSKEVARGNFEVEEVAKWNEKRILEELTKFKGIGEWTAKMVAIAGLGIGQAPAEDLGIRKAISKYYFNGKLREVEIVRDFMKNWKDLKYLPVYLLYAYRIGLEV